MRKKWLPWDNHVLHWPSFPSHDWMDQIKWFRMNQLALFITILWRKKDREIERKRQTAKLKKKVYFRNTLLAVISTFRKLSVSMYTICIFAFVAKNNNNHYSKLQIRKIVVSDSGIISFYRLRSQVLSIAIWMQ